MTQTQSQTFAQNWTVIDQYDGTVEETYVDEFGQEHTFLNHTGLSVTLFEDNSGKQVVAIRGTEPSDPADIITDVIDIGVLGTSEHQAQYAALSARVQQWMDNGSLHSGFSVTGHSLGGFLATNLTLEYSADITHTFIYNAPGVTGVGGDILEAITNALSPDNPLAIPATLPISNIVATADIVSSVGLSIAPPITISVDAESPFLAHSIVGLTSALAVYNLFATISGSDNVYDFTPFLENMSDERTLQVVNAIFQAGADTTGEVVDLARDLTEYVGNNALTGLTVASLHDQSVSALHAAAESDNSVLFALQELSGFTISGNQPGYAGLDPDNYSSQYLEDRAVFLYYTMHENTTAIQYDQEGSGIRVAPPSDIHVPARYWFGTDQGDNLYGHPGANREDHFYGMAGDDTLIGGTGSDTMNGGEGTDTILGGDLDDTIRVNSLSLAENSIEVIDGGGGNNNVIAGTSGDNTIDLSGINVSHINRIEGGGWRKAA
ncbi:MAG TPA: hypothetical protein ENJ30_13690 [Desulfobulbaceae bacterium]|nr:hypothetical protein [Desulfobulbaceae bacterium]